MCRATLPQNTTEDRKKETKNLGTKNVDFMVNQKKTEIPSNIDIKNNSPTNQRQNIKPPNRSVPFFFTPAKRRAFFFEKS